MRQVYLFSPLSLTYRRSSLCSHSCTGQSFNRPTTSACVAWNPVASTFANSTTIGTSPSTVFITVNNSVFVTSTDLNRIVMWSSAPAVSPTILASTLTRPRGLFVASTGKIYVDNGLAFGRVETWTSDGTTSLNSVNVSVNSSCFGLFLVEPGSLYCSLGSLNRVVTVSLSNLSTTSALVAGTGENGSSSNTLSDPHGIFVDAALDLYVADSGNNRIQLFPRGASNATTVAGDGAPGTISLSRPRAVVVDVVDVLFIADTMNHRIVASGPGRFRCLVGCTGTAGSAANELNTPASLSFDRDGHLFVVDGGNARIQKFDMQTISCRKLR